MKTESTTSNPKLPIRWALMGARWILGGVFIYLGLIKTLDPVSFLKLIHEYHTLPEPLFLNAAAALLPWFEIVCGLFLITGFARRGASLLLFLLLAGFTVAIFRRGWELHLTQHIPFCEVRFDCGCGTGEVALCHKLLENSSLMLLALLIFATPQRPGLKPDGLS